MEFVLVIVDDAREDVEVADHDVCFGLAVRFDADHLPDREEQRCRIGDANVDLTKAVWAR